MNVKGLVGAVANKNGLVHWRVGFPAIGGDEYPSFSAWLKGQASRVKKRGAWHGNDTIWRMTADLYLAMLERGPRRRFSIIDGIHGGEGNGPFCPRLKRSCALIAGADLLAVDSVATRLMGFDVAEVPYLRRLGQDFDVRSDNVSVASDLVDSARFWEPGVRHLDFAPPDGWPRLRVGAGR